MQRCTAKPQIPNVKIQMPNQCQNPNVKPPGLKTGSYNSFRNGVDGSFPFTLPSACSGALPVAMLSKAGVCSYRRGVEVRAPMGVQTLMQPLITGFLPNTVPSIWIFPWIFVIRI
jgi:hypothetical protein